MLTNINSPRSICILRLSAIGDVCHAVATVQAIQHRWPDTSITWIIGKVELQLVAGLAGVEFIVFDKKAGLKGYWELKKKLNNRKFDILLHMQVALRASLVTLFIKARERWGFDRFRAKEGQWLFTNRQIAAQNEPHVADGFMGFAKAIGVEQNTILKWSMPIKDEDELWWQKQPHSGTKYIVIAPAASKAERNWLPERYAEIANMAYKKGLDVLICGAPTEMEKALAKAIESYCDFQPINLIGGTSLKQLLVVIKHAVLVLAPDTGPAHMAVTVGTPVIGLYAHSNPKRTGPYAYQDYVVSVYEQLLIEQTGQPSTQHRWGKRVKGDVVMGLIEVEEVVKAFDKVIDDINVG
ncbi:glycosyltransferase family 9 protein [Aliikangiella sp. IMCC44359]|uniref:glycosyltransferase family 9 protein n=1 Tax=Aliikangiella sp. IMCC44359 TaxID=3459125 RepID=UPI00403B1ACA